MSIRPGPRWSRVGVELGERGGGAGGGVGTGVGQAVDGGGVLAEHGHPAGGHDPRPVELAGDVVELVARADQQALGEALVAVVGGVDGLVGEIDRVEQAVFGAGA